MMQLQDSQLENFGMEDCRYALRALEIEAYSTIVSAFRAQGSLGQYYRLILEHLRLILNVSPERHKAEIRRVLTDPILSNIATGLNPTQTDINFEWREEAKRICGDGNYASSLSMDSPAFYRYNFVRSSKNDTLLELADRLALMAADHNRSSKSLVNGETKFFQALKKPKLTPLLTAREKKLNEIIPVLFKAPPEKSTNEPAPPPSKELAIISNTATNTRGTKMPIISANMKRKSTNQNETLASAAAISAISTTSSTTTTTSPLMKKNAGRPRKRPLETFQSAKQRVGKFIVPRTTTTANRGGTIQRGRGGKKFIPTVTTVPTSSMIPPHLSPQRSTPIKIGQQTYSHPQSPPFYSFYPQGVSSIPRTPPRSLPLSITSSTPPVVSNQPASGQRTPLGRQYRKRPAYAPTSTTAWQAPDQSFRTAPKLNAPAGNAIGAGSRVPVAPLAVMLPVSTSATSRGSVGGTSRFYAGPSSPTRPLLTGEAPGVYADDYNANSMMEAVTVGATTVGTTDMATSSPSGGPMQPHHFFSSLSATYFAQNPPPTTTTSPSKTKRVSPAAASTNLNLPPANVATSAGAGGNVSPTRLTGITVKAKSGNGGGTTTSTSSDGGGSGNGAANETTATKANFSKASIGNLSMHRLEQSAGQKVIVLPSSIIRRAQQQQLSQRSGTSATPSDAKSTPLGQNVIIVRRTTSMPSTSATISTTTTPISVTLTSQIQADMPSLVPEETRTQEETSSS